MKQNKSHVRAYMHWVNATQFYKLLCLTLRYFLFVLPWHKD